MGNRHVQLTYENRNDRRSSYLAGGLSEQTMRLSAITTYYGVEEVREYSFGYLYSVASQRSLLDWIKECGYKSGSKVCLPATQFEWQDAAFSYGQAEPLTLGGQEVYAGVVNIEAIVPHGDIDGNGSTDFPGYSTNAEQEITATNNLTGYETCHFESDIARHRCFEADFDLDGRVDGYKIENDRLWVDYSADSSGFVRTSIRVKRGAIAGQHDVLLYIGDMNGNGYADVVVSQFDDGRPKVKVYLHSGNTLPPSFLPGEEIYALVYRPNPTGGGVVAPYLPSESAAIVGDISGNGLPDLVISQTHLPGIGSWPMPLTKVIKLNKSSPGNLVFEDISSPLSTDGHGTDYRLFNFLIDVNGDGLPDYLAWHDGITYLHLNLGGGDFGPRISLGQDAQFSTRSSQQVVGPGIIATFFIPKYFESFRVADLNGDGKLELLLPGQRMVDACSRIYDARDAQHYDLCGDGLYGEIGVIVGDNHPTQLIDVYFYDDSIYRYDAIYFDQLADGSYQARREPTDIVGSASQIQVVDLFGDGLADIIFNYGARHANWIDNPGSSMFGTHYGASIIRNYGAGSEAAGYEPYDMLVDVENGVGFRDEWHYRPLSSGDARYNSIGQPFYEPDFDYLDGLDLATQADHFHFTSSMYVVAEHRQSNGVGSLNHRQYRYKGALYNNKGRGFQGFRSIIVEDLAAGVEAQNDFHQVFPLAGKLHKIRKWVLGDRASDLAGTDAFEETDLQWQFWPKGGHGSPVVVDALTDSWTVSANDPYFIGPKSQSTIRRTLNKSGNSRTDLFIRIQTGSFDPWGNVLVQTEIYEEADLSHIVSSTTNTQYVAADQGNWWIDKPLKQTVIKHAVQNRAGVAIEAGTDIQQSIVAEYSNWDSGVRKPKRIKTTPSTGKWAQTDIEYNSYGAPEMVLAGAEGETIGRSVAIAYSNDGYFPRMVTNALNHIVAIETNPRFGVPDSVTDANGLITTYEFDAFGRAVKVTAPSSGGLSAAPEDHISLRWCAGGACANASQALFKTIQEQAGTPTRVSYHDILGRVIREEIQAFDGVDSIVIEKEFNALGQISFESVPHFLSAQDNYGTRYLDYDTLGRILHKTVDQTNGRQLDTQYTYEQGGNGFTTAIQVNGRSMSRTYNGLQQLTKTVDALNGITQYAYDGAGNPISMQDASGNRTTAKYNALGQKEWVDDPNMGIKTFTYTGFGDLEAEADANGNSTLYMYDLLGRIESRAVNGLEEARWTYDSVNGIGLPAMESRSDAAFSRSYNYDALSRPREVTTIIDGELFVVTAHIDKNYGRAKGLTYPSGLTLHYRYNDSGYQYKTSNAASQYTYREITDLDTSGQWRQAHTAAGNYTIDRAFHAETGQMESSLLKNLLESHQTLTYTYDDFGNLHEQTVLIPASTPSANTETFTYDRLNRLFSSGRTNGPTIEYDYDAVGNLLKKTDFATSYSYTGGGSGGPNAVRSVALAAGGTVTYGYDANGNRTLENGVQQVWYNAFNKPTRVNRYDADLTFHYGADQMRYKQVNQSAGVTTLYIDKLFEKITTGGQTRYRHFIDDIAVLTATETDTGSNYNIGFIHRDRLGSAVAVADENGNLRETHSYDPFGKPRFGNSQDKQPAVLQSLFTVRGFTDHEHLDDVQLIHMNGRAYDYNLGRFLSVDPIIQSPSNSQSLNPYSYIMNNPLAGTDPSGYVSKGIESFNEEEIKWSNIITIELPGEITNGRGNSDFAITLSPGDIQTLESLGQIGENSGPKGRNPGLLDQYNSSFALESMWAHTNVWNMGISNVDCEPCHPIKPFQPVDRAVIDQGISLTGDFTPIIGSLKSIGQLYTGKDLVTDEPVNRWFEGAGILLGIIPFGKVLTKGDEFVTLYHGSRKIEGGSFDLQIAISMTRQATLTPGIYLTDDFARAATVYGRGGEVARVRVPKSLADKFYNPTGGPNLNQPEWIFNTQEGVDALNKYLEILPTNEAIKSWW